MAGCDARPVLAVNWTTIRLFMHVLAATIWVGGQFTLAGLVPVLRSVGADAPRLAARRFNRIAWPAYVVLILTGLWNAVAERDHLHGRYAVTFAVKLAVVVASGLAAFWHTRARTPSRIALFGALSGLAALAALFLGILLAG